MRAGTVGVVEQTPGALQLVRLREAEDGLAVAQDEGDATVLLAEVLRRDDRAQGPAGEVEQHGVAVIATEGRHALAAADAEPVVQEARRLLHAGAELRVAEGAAMALAIVEDEEGLVGRDPRVQRQQVWRMLRQGTMRCCGATPWTK